MGIRTMSPWSGIIPIFVVERIIPEVDAAFRGVRQIMKFYVLRNNNNSHALACRKRHLQIDALIARYECVEL